MSRTRKALFAYDSRKEVLFVTKVRFRKITDAKTLKCWILNLLSFTKIFRN